MKEITNSYDKLYNNMRSRFTVSDNSVGYTLGDYMLMKANDKKTEAALPVALRTSATKGERAVATIATYVNDKLTIKAPPAKDKTLRAFPLRSSASAFLSASVACAFILSFCLIGAKVMNTTPSDVSETSVTENADDARDSASATVAVSHE